MWGSVSPQSPLHLSTSILVQSPRCCEWLLGKVSVLSVTKELHVMLGIWANGGVKRSQISPGIPFLPHSTDLGIHCAKDTFLFEKNVNLNVRRYNLVLYSLSMQLKS